MEISSYRGIRHRRLTSSWSKTKNNARTRKGPVKTVANKKKIIGKGGKNNGT